MPKKHDFSRKIIKILADKPAISLEEMAERIDPENTLKYAFNRSLKGLKDSGFIEHISSSQSDYARLTREGKKKAHSIRLESDNAVLNTSWDGYWRIILLDVPEERKSEREALRYLLKKANFICVKNSVWVSMYPFEHLFNNIKKDLGLSTEMMIIVTNKLDVETESEFLKLISQK